MIFSQILHLKQVFVPQIISHIFRQALEYVLVCWGANRRCLLICRCLRSQE